MNNIYQLDPKWQRLLNTNNFLGGLTVDEFVQELCKDDSLKQNSTSTSIIEIQGRNGIDDGTTTAFEKLDPKPYIRTLESILKELNSLNEESSNKKADLANQVALQELTHAENVIQLSSNLNSAFQTYDNLDTKLSNVIQVVAPLGDKLESAIRKKKSYIKSIDLINQYNSFYVDDKVSDQLESLRTSPNWKKKLQAVILVKNVLILAHKIETNSLPKTSQTTQIIEEYAGLMENSLLENFNSAYRDNNFIQLNEIALILDHLNGGVNVIQSFINQHSYFIDAKQLELDEKNGMLLLDEAIKVRLMNVEIHGVIYEDKMLAILNDIEEVIKKESKIVKRVFEERAPRVLQLFIQRIFAQKIESKVEFLLSTSLSLSDLAFVRMLHGLYSLFGNFVKDLSEYFQALELNSDNNLSSTLDQCYSDLFSKYLFDRSNYFDIEKRSLEAILIEKTSNFSLKHEKEVRSKALLNNFNNKYLNGRNNQNNTSKLDESLGSNYLTNKDTEGKLSQINNFFKSHLDRDLMGSRGGSFKRTNTNSDLNRNSNDNSNSNFNSSLENDNQPDPDFNLKSADSMLKCVVESIARLMELTPNKTADFSFEVLELIFVGIINSYIEVSLEIAYYKITKVDAAAQSDINLSYLQYLAISTEIISLISASIKVVFLPLLVNSPDIKKKLIALTNNQIKKCEMLINLILEEVSQVFESKFINALSKQKKKDFVPNEKDLLDQDTVPAVEIGNIIIQLHSQAVLYLKGKNLENFLSKIGDILYRLLLDHYGKFQVNSIGGIVITKDIIGIQNTIEEWASPYILDKFATLRELANLFTVQPDLLESLTKEGHLQDLNKDIISTYISNREDFNHESFINNVKMSFKQRVL
ncbi:hypothetical protein TBLA_0H00970 [Henningerozyma blattae CBS 6284]|uniref:Uncharacterized protein n=1 Tax=Henningerozyma blattae (strain ATCC 34711 / CBS 6284 / DSM 70876 / NBRC 10599 / NRRL Y-10934 / UCD 77-7) TaxID=1071380 RepID=I2H7N3_HENB6|nr:hypothetical protein TBLA_0H00970 [Tetrapisispora blattae CBS 6284]CCH62385.1 hypothetical protein TBLA_0H00970 [Tetrapisispora blattae CBS 6284]